MAELTTPEVLRRRIAIQRLAGNPLPTATEVVRLLTCVQSQEWSHAFWSLGMRTVGLTHADVQAEFDAGRILRTHVLRPTWHLVAAEDIRWILAATSPRVQQTNGTIYRREGLDQATLDRGAALIADLLRGGNYLSRAQLAEALAATGLVAERFKVAYVIMNAELEGVICSGPLRGAQHTYALLDERTPRSADATGDVGELARRFFAGHGPASTDDLARWASLTKSQAREAVAAVAHRLERVVADGTELWFDPQPMADGGGAGTDALLVPLFDELTLSYPTINFPVAEGHPHRPGDDLFVGCVLLDLTNVGLWRRVVQGPKVIMEVTLVPAVSSVGRGRIEAAAERLAAFLGKRLELTIAG
jgi:DNA glycosylase AlkZ-like